MAKTRGSGDAGNKAKGHAKGAGASTASRARRASDGPKEAAGANGPADAAARVVGPTRRQVREIARLVGRLEALGELEARRRRQLHVALEKGRKTKRHRQQVERAAGRVGELIDRLRTLARELESPVPAAAAVLSATPAPSSTLVPSSIASAPNSAPKPARTTTTAVAAPAMAPKPRQATARTQSKPAASRARPKPADA
jgi:hypothetical protein